MVKFSKGQNLVKYLLTVLVLCTLSNDAMYQVSGKYFIGFLSY